MNKINMLNKKIVIKYILILTAIIISSFLFSLGIKMFLSSAKAFSSGLGALPQLITYIVPSLSQYFSLLYFIFNIPFIIVFYLISKKKFVILTTIWLLFQVMWGQVMNAIPQISGADPFQIGIFDKTNLISGYSDSAIGMVKEKWANILQPLIAGFIVGLGMVLAWKAGASSGGTDFVTFYISFKYKKPVGTIAMVISTAIAMLMIILEIILGKVPTGGKVVSQIFGPITWGTLIYINVQSWILNVLYPKYKKVNIEITSNNPEKIIKFLSDNSFHHAWVIFEGKSGYTGLTKKHIKTVVLFLEAKELIKEIQKIDPDVWISTNMIREVIGNFNTKVVE